MESNRYIPNSLSSTKDIHVNEMKFDGNYHNMDFLFTDPIEKLTVKYELEATSEIF